jgi:tetratricopeptide (TPR) repeat protein
VASGGAQKRPTAHAPQVPADITGQELDSAVRRELGTLPRLAAARVARHLVAAGRFIDDDPELALEHAMAARREGARLGVVRETCGYAAYAAGRYEQALAELRAARRITGSLDYVPVMADCERGLGRPERALDLLSSVDRRRLSRATRIELLIVEAGARRDLGQPAAALAILDIPELHGQTSDTPTARLRYAYADALETLGRREEATEWFARAAAADVDGETDADDRWQALM